ncbi:hypothetical protein [Methanobrevibacter sp.]
MLENSGCESTERFVSLDIFKNKLDDKVKELEEANGRIEELEAEIFELKKQLRKAK